MGQTWDFLSFWPYTQKVFNARPWNLGYRHIVGTFRCVWKLAPVGQIFWPFLAPNSAKIRPKAVFHLFCKSFPLDSHETCLLSSLELLLEVCRILAPRSYTSGPFLTPNKARIRPKSQFFFCFAKGAIGFTWNYFFKLTWTTLRSV